MYLCSVFVTHRGSIHVIYCGVNVCLLYLIWNLKRFWVLKQDSPHGFRIQCCGLVYTCTNIILRHTVASCYCTTQVNSVKRPLMTEQEVEEWTRLRYFHCKHYISTYIHWHCRFKIAPSSIGEQHARRANKQKAVLKPSYTIRQSVLESIDRRSGTSLCTDPSRPYDWRPYQKGTLSGILSHNLPSIPTPSTKLETQCQIAARPSKTFSRNLLRPLKCIYICKHMIPVQKF